MADLHHECGIAAVYHLPVDEDGAGDDAVSPIAPLGDAGQASRLIPRILLDIQNRGQLAAGLSSYRPGRKQLLDTYKNLGGVTEVFKLNRADRYRTLMDEYAGPAAIGHVRYATCGPDDRGNAQPFERHHLERRKWFSFAFNGQLSNYRELRDEIEGGGDFHLARETDTEILLHLFSRELSRDPRVPFAEMLGRISAKLDGAYNIAFLNAAGEMFLSRDPLGLRPLCWAKEGPLFAAASESVALANLGFREGEIHSLEPGTVVSIRDGEVTHERYAHSPRTAHCFFEWIYFANVASTLDDRSVYLVRKALGEELAAQEQLRIDEDTIVVPVPDTAKAAADAMAYRLGVPCLEGLFRNRYIGRTFIEGNNRSDKVRLKYTPLPEVLAGKRVIVVEDTIVRSTTLKTLVSQLRERGGAREVHVRVACPPIIAPCFYGIDMSTVGELFAPPFLFGQGGTGGPGLTPEIERAMADKLEADSLRYLPLDAISRAVALHPDALCQACIDRDYPTAEGRRLYQLALSANTGGRTYDAAGVR